MKKLLIRAIVPALIFLTHFAVAQQGSRTIFLIRDAEAISPAPGAVLTPAGEKRAECLAQTLMDAGIKQIYVSDAKRSQQTAAPLAARLKVSPSTIPAKDVSTLVRNLLYGTSGNVLVVGRGDTLPVVIQRLQAGNVPTIPDGEFGKLFVVTVMEGAGTPVATLRYCDVGASSAPTVASTAKLQASSAAQQR